MQAAATLIPRSPRIVPLSRIGDESLASRAAAGDEAAFAALYERYHGPLESYCRSILLDAEDARDAAQSALENALRALPRREPDRPLRPWLYRIAHNEAINVVRRRRPAGEPVDPADLLTVPGPEHDAEQRSRLAQLVDDLRTLPERQRGALVMRELSGLSYDDIALALGVSPEAARRAVFDARSALHDAVDGRAAECVSIRRCLSDGDRRRLRARPIRAHLRWCDDCATFERAITTREADLHALGPWLGGAGAVGLIGLGGGGAWIATGGGATTGGLAWTGLPAAVKGLAVAAAVATTGTSAVELPKVAAHRPATSAAHRVASTEHAAPAAISPTYHLRATGPTRADHTAGGRSTPARVRVRTSTAAPPAARRDAASVTAIAPPAPGAAAPARPQAPTPSPAPRRPATSPRPTVTPQQLAAQRLQAAREQLLAAFETARAMAAAGTPGGMTAASSLIASTLATFEPEIQRILAGADLELPWSIPQPPTTTTTSTPTATTVLAPAQSLLDGVDRVLGELFGSRR